MALTKAQMLALLADNTSGDISAQDMRDIISGVVTIEDEGVNIPTIPVNEAWIASRTYDFKSTGISDGGNPIIIQATAYADLATLVTPARDAGVYEIKFSTTFSYDSTSRSAYFQWSLDGGTAWEEFRIEPKDVTDVKALDYSFPFNHTGGVMNIQLQGRCENASDTLEVRFANIVFERKR